MSSKARLIALPFLGLFLCLVLIACGASEEWPTPSGPTATPRPRQPAPTPVSYPFFEPGRCPSLLSTTLPHDCGHLHVPEDRDHPEGRVVKLPVIIFRSTSPNPAPDPLIYLPEGGGLSQIHDYERIVAALGEDVLARRDLILYNQRGSELTFPHFFCDKYSEFLWEISSKSWSQVEHNLAVQIFWRTCYESLEARDLDLKMYDSVNNAADADDLRRALGLEQANFYATGYGTRIGLALIRDHPEGVRSLIVDSVQPPQVDYYAERAGNAMGALQTLFESCAADAYCREQYPDLREEFFAAADLLDRRPVTVRHRRGPLAIDGGAFLEAIHAGLASPELIPLLPQMIHEAAAGHVVSLEATVLDNLNTAHSNPALLYAAQCREELPFTTHEKVLTEIEALPDQVAGFFGASYADFAKSICEWWDVAPADSLESEAVVSSVPTLVLAGQFDPVSPPRWGRLAIETLESGHFVEVPGAGQRVLTTCDCGLSLGLSFLENPEQPPESDCLAAATLPRFDQDRPVPRFEPSGCYFNYQPGSHQVECGYLIVPEDRSRPDGPTVKLHVAVFKSKAARPAPDPVVYVAGGGGANHLDAYQLYLDKGGYKILRHRDYIMYNQRGTRYNYPEIGCPGKADLMRRQAMQGLSKQEREAQTADFFAACYADVQAEGINVVPYDSDDNAADLNDLRLALGYDQVNLYGTSYGTRVILGVLRDFPEGVRSAILDSVYPPQVSLYVDLPHNAQRAFETVFQDCAADPECDGEYPNLRDTFFLVVDELNADPMLVGTIWVDGHQFMDALFSALYRDYATPQIPKWIEQASHGNHSGLVWFYEAGIVNDNADRAIAHGVHYTLLCREEAPFNSEIEALALADRLHPAIRDWMGWPDPDLAICQAWSVGIADPIENQPVSSDVPTLILAGRYDPITPPAWGRLAGETLSQSYFYEFPGLGHGIMRASECALDVGLDFVADPAVPPDSGCLADEAAPDFD